jgi:pimeloyl-ACP methyl ester carboxylesterase
MKSQIARTSRGPIEYTLLGDGPPVLVCHGTSSNCFSTELSKPLVEAGFRVLTPSRPGYGRTPLEVGRSAADAARALIALLDSFQVQTCAVVATSGGGPTGVALAAGFPQRVTPLMLVEAITRPEERPNEPAYKNQVAFYGPLHALMWHSLGLMSRLSPRSTARQVLAIFSSHDPDDGLSRLSSDDIQNLCHFFWGRSSRRGALNDLTHTVGAHLLMAVQQPTLVVHSREDKSVPFSHAEWSLAHIAHAELCEAGFTGHFFWIGPDFTRLSQKIVAFLRGSS